MGAKVAEECKVSNAVTLAMPWVAFFEARTKIWLKKSTSSRLSMLPTGRKFGHTTQKGPSKKKWGAGQIRGPVGARFSQKGPKREFWNSCFALLFPHECVEQLDFPQILILKRLKSQMKNVIFTNGWIFFHSGRIIWPVWSNYIHKSWEHCQMCEDKWVKPEGYKEMSSILGLGWPIASS